MSDSQEEISTEPGLVSTTGSAGAPGSPLGPSSQRSPSRALLFLKAAHVISATALTGYNIPFAQAQWKAGDRLPMFGVAAAVVLIATRAGFADVKDALLALLPFGKGKK